MASGGLSPAPRWPGRRGPDGKAGDPAAAGKLRAVVHIWGLASCALQAEGWAPSPHTEPGLHRDPFSPVCAGLGSRGRRREPRLQPPGPSSVFAQRLQSTFTLQL